MNSLSPLTIATISSHCMTQSRSRPTLLRSLINFLALIGGFSLVALIFAYLNNRKT